ncbi:MULTISPECIES: DoxX family membrane protein [unclassified Streptomyces]|uniref:DoxX family membrane protein n=1 Tax=unclassified Streptomyces TaxID=2593676 RepID=UPI00215623C5|nr:MULTISPECIES: DoxX family membrane protein [unclassified Streptomyces]
MSVLRHARPQPTTAVPEREPASGAAAPAAPYSPAARLLAALRITTGLIFLWAFLDKTFGFGYATTSERAWVNGGSPAAGYRQSVQVGPLESTFHAWSGAVWVDWAYMAGMLGLGLALVAGIGLRIAAVSGTGMMLLLWGGAWPGRP